ncbi:MAG: hypothetical protein ACXV8U_15600 [Methylobacter sp.]
MNSSQTLLFDKVPVKDQNSPKRTRLFYSGAAALLLALMFLGFLQFYLHGRAYPNRELAPSICEHYSSCMASVIVSLFLRQLVLGIQAQASGKNSDTIIYQQSFPRYGMGDGIRPVFCHVAGRDVVPYYEMAINAILEPMVCAGIRRTCHL